MERKTATSFTFTEVGKIFFIFFVFLIATRLQAQPVCNAHFSHYSIHNPDSVHFYPASNGATAHYYWTFGDGSSSTLQAPWHYYAGPGTYYACLTVTDTTTTGTCTDTWCDSVHVTAPVPPTCNAHFSHYSNPHNSDSVHFYPATNGSTAHFYWTFGDGSSSHNQDPWHLYASSGTYYACLTVTDTTSAGSCTDTWCDSVHVTAPTAPTCNAHFSHYSNPHNSDSVHFYPPTNGATAYYYWTFGDGSSSTLQAPWHYYANAGTYYACLTVTDTTSAGTCTDTWCDSVHVVAPVPPTCNAHFSHYSNPHNSDSVHFYPATNGSTAHYYWTFGDGSSSHNQDPWHLYANAGIYYACLTVTDTTSAGSCTDTWCDSVHVTGPTPPACNAHFSHYSMHNPDSVHFYPSSNTNGSTAHYYWTFGDGTTSAVMYPWHYYTNPGTYYVCLTVTDTTSAGTCTDTWCDSVHVSNPVPPVCIAHFVHYSIHNPDSVHFYPASNGSTAHYNWTFGDGSSSTSHDPWHYYAGAGTYYTCLTVTDTTSAGTCTDTWCDSVYVAGPVAPVQIYPNPVDNFISVNVQNNNNPITFKIYDNKGRLVYNRDNIGNGGFNIDTGGMSTGSYFYQAYEGSQRIANGKLMVIKK